MGRTIVNKHTSNINEINGLFHDNIEYAKGEIVILNGNEENAEASLYIINGNGVPQPIIGVNETNSVGIDVINAVKSEYKAADVLLKNELNNTISSSVDGVSIQLRSELNNEIIRVESAMMEADNSIQGKIDEAKTEYSSLVINGIEVYNEETPIIKAKDIPFGQYVQVDRVSDFIMDNDTTQEAVKKIENMLLANALAVSASLNDINKKTISQLIFKHDSPDENGYYELNEGGLNIIENINNEYKFRFPYNDVNMNSTILYDVLFTFAEEGNISVKLPEGCLFTTLPLSELENGGTYLFKFKYNFVEIIRMHALQ